MIMNSQGHGHFLDGINNQDFGIESPNAVVILDGCSGAKYSEIGTRLFAQLLSRKEEWDKVEKFEDNVKCVFEDLIDMVSKYYKTSFELEQDFIMENLLFTIIACFETNEQYIVKLFGDGYIITQNERNIVSYMKFSYGKQPPYFAYRYTNIAPFNTYTFKTFCFDKKVFPKVCIASDGIMPVAKGKVEIPDDIIFTGSSDSIGFFIKRNRQIFYDDVTIARLGGDKNV